MTAAAPLPRGHGSYGVAARTQMGGSATLVVCSAGADMHTWQACTHSPLLLSCVHCHSTNIG
eukprot:2867656-Prorocentrum_lima.AAC.1